MANRICIGQHPNHGQGIFISRPGVNVLSNVKKEDLVFDSRSPESSLVHEVVSATITTGNHTGAVFNFATALSYVPHVDLVFLGTSASNSAQFIPTQFQNTFVPPSSVVTRYWLTYKCKVTSSSCQVSFAFDTQTASSTLYFKVVVYKMESLT